MKTMNYVLKLSYTQTFSKNVCFHTFLPETASNQVGEANSACFKEQ